MHFTKISQSQKEKTVEQNRLSETSLNGPDHHLTLQKNKVLTEPPSPDSDVYSESAIYIKQSEKIQETDRGHEMSQQL